MSNSDSLKEICIQNTTEYSPMSFQENKMNSRAEEEVFKAGKELDNAREELNNFKARIQ